MKLAFVVPRYGEEILGGAEFITRQFAEHLPQSEFEVTVLTTCARDLGKHVNVYPVGMTCINDVQVWRFPVDPRFCNTPRFHELTTKILQGFSLTVDEEYEWIDHNIHSPALYAYIAQHGRDYDLLFFVPYLFGTTFYGMTLCPERSVLWPCLHDEAFAYFLQTRLMLESGCGIMFNSEPEKVLAQEKLGIRHPAACVVGGGMVGHPADPARFRAQSGLSEPFILYAGRLDPFKNVAELLTFFVEYKRRCPESLKLVVMGEGGVPIPNHPDIIPIGFQDEQRKLDVFAAATVLVQPSLMESFSFVIMESWSVGVPVIVHGDCAVTRYHVSRSNGGLYYNGFEEFAGALDWLLTHPLERAQMGILGCTYVQREYNWETVIDRFREATILWQNESKTLRTP
ncbi:MAG: glycosyltransferase family 4 protein [Anaerolineae bacterium]|nr:glycosyltransferase family 4 protein [Anaerolineae bacterium]